jgi:hypothetical protein
MSASDSFCAIAGITFALASSPQVVPAFQSLSLVAT